MAVESAPFYWLTCDRCGVRSTRGSDYDAWAEVEHAEIEAEESNWSIEGGNHLCWDCTPIYRNDEDEATMVPVVAVGPTT